MQKENKGASQSHDTQAPANLVQFMLKHWKPPSNKLPKPVKNSKNFAERRKRLAKAFPDDVLIIPTGHAKVRSNDTYYSFRPGTDFYYLVGNMEPDCVLVLVPEVGSFREVLFVEPNPGKTDITFFTDRQKGELWEGPRLGINQSKALFGIAECKSLVELPAFLSETLPKHQGQYRLLRGFSDSIASASWIQKSALQKDRDHGLATYLSEMRLIKDKEEIRALREAIQSTKRGFEDVIARMKTAKSERELEGVFYTRARTEGNDVGYASIVASGEHACILHWKKNSGQLHKNDLLLLDAGVEGEELYTADVTRTLPIGGKFNKEQRLIYDLVLSAQKAAMKAVKPGNDFMEPNRAAMKVLAFGLEALGILPMSAEEALKEENQFYKRYSLHNVSHMLGLDVHDCAKARMENYKHGKLKAGMVLTIEPGLYFQVDDTTVPSRFRGIGIRIEDDVVVTEKSCQNLSGILPVEADDIEVWIRNIWKKR